MIDITVALKKEDVELIDSLKENFGADLCFYESKGFDGSEFVFVVLIPVQSITIDIIYFFWNHFAKEKDKGRVIINEGQEICIEGYTADEVKEILEVIYKNRNDWKIFEKCKKKF